MDQIKRTSFVHDSIRVALYNVHGGVGGERRLEEWRWLPWLFVVIEFRFSLASSEKGWCVIFFFF